MQLAREATGENFEGEFMNRLTPAKSNIPEMKNGKMIYKQYVKPAMASA
jgi:hypothetical protein